MAFCRKRLGSCNLQGDGLPQAIRGLQFRGSCFLSNTGVNCSLLCCLASSYWRIAILRLLSCFKSLGNSNLQGLALHQAIGELHLSGFCFVSSKLLRDCDLEALVSCRIVSYAASTYWGIPTFRVLLCAKPLGNTDKIRRVHPCATVSQNIGNKPALKVQAAKSCASFAYTGSETRGAQSRGAHPWATTCRVSAHVAQQ